MSIEILGTTASVISLVYMALGLPAQIWKNFKSKSVQGLSLFMMIMLFLTTTSWVVYAWPLKNWYIIVSNVPGSVFALIILGQFLIYRDRRV